MTVIVNEPWLADRIRAEREQLDGAWHDEVWDGIYIIPPVYNNEHQWIVGELLFSIHEMVDCFNAARLFPGVVVSDREEGWLENYRVPDVAVVLQGNPAKDCDTHWCGGPDFVAEIVTPNDLAREKRPFYAKIGVRELLIVDRNPWALELYQLDAGQLALAGTSTPERPEALRSAVFPLVFRTIPSADRPRIEVTRADGGQPWLI